MHEPGDEPLPGAGLTLDENGWEPPTGRLALQQAPQLLPQGADDRALPEQFGQRFHGRLAYAVAQTTAQISEHSEHSVVAAATVGGP